MTTTSNNEGQQGDMSKGNSELNEKTTVPLGVGIGVAVAIITFAFWANNSVTTWLKQIDSRLAAIEAGSKMSEMVANNRLAAMESRLIDRWSASDMKLWTMQLRMDNPSLKVPTSNQPRE